MSTSSPNELIIESLELCGFHPDPQSIDNMKLWAMKHIVDSSSEFIYLQLDDWLRLINIISPELILPDHMYFMKGLNEKYISILCKTLKKKKLEATIRQVQEMAFRAEELNEYDDKINDMKHAVNYVIKIFLNDRWETPIGFEDKFFCYRKKIPSPPRYEKPEASPETVCVYH